jgi:WD40 repeat protein
MSHGEMTNESCVGTMQVRVWDLKTLNYKGKLVDHNHSIKALAASDGRIYSGGYAKDIKVWDIEDMLCLATLSGHTSGITALVVGLNSRYLFSGSVNGTIRWGHCSCA